MLLLLHTRQNSVYTSSNYVVNVHIMLSSWLEPVYFAGHVKCEYLSSCYYFIAVTVTYSCDT